MLPHQAEKEVCAYQMESFYDAHASLEVLYYQASSNWSLEAENREPEILCCTENFTASCLLKPRSYGEIQSRSRLLVEKDQIPPRMLVLQALSLDALSSVDVPHSGYCLSSLCNCLKCLLILSHSRHKMVIETKAYASRVQATKPYELRWWSDSICRPNLSTDVPTLNLGNFSTLIRPIECPPAPARYEMHQHYRRCGCSSSRTRELVTYRKS
jgi:hypothetical protein